ncbi:hypothetical protein [Mucilaginibacter sp. KACC 22063]|uniref:hypothetical protein n=1 Tax=Mucilaginibacter sp. KACC 22063 TaxID=3025666 RepID=UPI0023672A4A|nr:hypothetical protein [Mucilaginibacter sp. KACC 22063]WDF56090.1 hypothetical protein PQ461_03325 [Mucilaginibacter sp. KACC 22063]
MSAYKPFFFLLFVILFFVVLYKVSHSPENDAEKYFKSYYTNIIKLEIMPIDRFEHNYTVDYTHYNTGFSLIGYKALSGKIFVFNFQDSISKKYFSLRIFDKSMEYTNYILPHLLDKHIMVYANKEDFDNPAYGTKQNPVPIFSFKGIEEPIRITSEAPESVNGYESIEPTQAEYEHNVLLYLKYIMPKEDFKKRFEGGK